jgi:hypothetical protein
VTLLAGGNPQIPKGDGDGPVQDYIALMPGWKREVGERLDALVAAAVPGARKAVKWNNPLYGVDGEGWFFSFRCFTKYVKLSFFNGTGLDPQPPESSKVEGVRYLKIHEGDELDEAQLSDWLRQAGEMPGLDLGANNS